MDAMLTGLLRQLVHAVPRAAQDIDRVIAPNTEQLRILVRDLLVDGFYVDEDAALDALHHEALFNAIDQRTAWKIDFIVCKSRPLSQEEFGRRRRVVFDGLTLWIATVEDVLIAKLEWARKANPGASSTTAPSCCECEERNCIEPTCRVGSPRSPGVGMSGGHEGKPADLRNRVSIAKNAAEQLARRPNLD